MSHPSLSSAVNNHSPLRVLHLLFTVLACLSLLIGSLIISVVWLGNGNISLFNVLTIRGAESLGGKFWATIFLLVPTLCVFGLLSTGALLLARQWGAAGLALPIAVGVFIGLYLFLVFVMPMAPALVYVLLLLLLNGGVLWLAGWSLTHGEGNVLKTPLEVSH
jgi:hypothetical protein